MSPSAQTAQMVVVWGQNKTEKEKGMSGSGRKQHTKGPDSLIEKGESVEGVGEEFEGSFVQSLRHETCCACWWKWVPPATHVSPITSGTASDQPASGRQDMPFQTWLLPHSDALSSSVTKSCEAFLGWGGFFFFSSLFKTFNSSFCRFSPAVLSLNIFLGKSSCLWLSHAYWWYAPKW